MRRQRNLWWQQWNNDRKQRVFLPRFKNPVRNAVKQVMSNEKTFSTGELKALLAEAVRAETRLPDIKLHPGERMSLSGHLFFRDSVFTREVGHAVKKDPPLFADIPVDPDALLQEQDRATLFLDLYETYRGLMERARDAYLLSQTGTTRKAMTVVEQVRGDDDRPYPRPDHEDRKLALSTAEQILTERHKGKLRKKKPPAPKSPPTTRHPSSPTLTTHHAAHAASAAAVSPFPSAAPAIAPASPTAPASRRPSPQARAVKEASRLAARRRIEESAGFADDRTRLCRSFELPGRRGLAGSASVSGAADSGRGEFARHPESGAGSPDPAGAASKHESGYLQE